MLNKVYWFYLYFLTCIFYASRAFNTNDNFLPKSIFILTSYISGPGAFRRWRNLMNEFVYQIINVCTNIFISIKLRKNKCRLHKLKSHFNISRKNLHLRFILIGKRHLDKINYTPAVIKVHKDFRFLNYLYLISIYYSICMSKIKHFLIS